MHGHLCTWDSEDQAQAMRDPQLKRCSVRPESVLMSCGAVVVLFVTILVCAGALRSKFGRKGMWKSYITPGEAKASIWVSCILTYKIMRSSV